MARTVFIYALAEPETCRVRYVGQSVTPFRRVRQHMHAGSHPVLRKWLKSIPSPMLILLAECSESEAVDYENFHMAKFRNAGEPLLNRAKAIPAKYGNQFTARVRCVETGEMFQSYAQAGRTFGVSGCTVKNKCANGQSCYPAGVHFCAL